MTGEQETFLKVLEEKPDDWVTRLIYSDWLEEHDQPEEADRQRNFKEAWDWLHDFADKCGMTCVNYDEYCADIHRRYQDWRAAGQPEGEPDMEGAVEQDWQKITYEDVIKAGYDYVNSEDYFTQLGAEDARDMMDEKTSKLYWKYWSIVTGGKAPLGDPKYGLGTAPFSCSC